jgi:hypothetical protein
MYTILKYVIERDDMMSSLAEGANARFNSDEPNQAKIQDFFDSLSNELKRLGFWTEKVKKEGLVSLFFSEIPDDTTSFAVMFKSKEQQIIMFYPNNIGEFTWKERERALEALGSSIVRHSSGQIIDKLLPDRHREVVGPFTKLQPN